MTNRTDKAGQPVALHASAPKGYKCADCQMDSEACPDCYKVWWHQRHPNTILVNSDSATSDSLAVAQALEEWESTFDCNTPREAYAEMRQAVLAHINTATAQALEAAAKMGRELQCEPIPDWQPPFKDGYRAGISEYGHRLRTLSAPAIAAEARRVVEEAKDAEIVRKLRNKVFKQRRELRRLNRYLGPYWAGFRKGMAMEGECKLRGIMNAAFGHEKVHAAERAAIDAARKQAT